MHIDVREYISEETSVERLRKALYLSMVKMKEIAMRKAPVDLGGLKAGIAQGLSPNTKNSDTYTLEDGVEYGLYVEYGTSPHWVPIKPLIEWAMRHGGDKGFAYAIQHKIAKYGMNAHPFFRPAFYEVKEKWIPFFFNKAMEGAL